MTCPTKLIMDRNCKGKLKDIVYGINVCSVTSGHNISCQYLEKVFTQLSNGKYVNVCRYNFSEEKIREDLKNKQPENVSYLKIDEEDLK